MSDTSSARPIRRAIVALIGVQVAIGAALMVIDLGHNWPGSDPLTAPGAPGPSTRPYSPDKRPGASPGVPSPSGPMPERLEITGDGAEITLTGQIAPGDAARIAEDLTRRADTGTPVTRVRLDSTGGSVSDALELGRSFRASGIATGVQAGAICLSACPYLFAGGTSRQADAKASIGVHQHYFGKSAILPAFMAVEDVQRGQSEVMAYLIEMDVDPAIMGPAMRTAPDQIYLLSAQELTDFRLITPES
ncbi:hypothetical protein ERN12_05185 [Rhodobacteraceae bacterium]|nr:hypothetical protein ERN12_05185 [Paracoccaceae bacterium]